MDRRGRYSMLPGTGDVGLAPSCPPHAAPDRRPAPLELPSAVWLSSSVVSFYLSWSTSAKLEPRMNKPAPTGTPVHSLSPVATPRSPAPLPPDARRPVSRLWISSGVMPLVERPTAASSEVRSL